MDDVKAKAKDPIESMTMAQPQEEHRWLERLVGTWAVEGECPGPDGETMTMTGTETVRSLGGLWILCEGTGGMPDGGPATTVMTLGYDPERGRYVGTFVGSMMTHLWHYEGTLDGAKKTLTLDTEGPNMHRPGTTCRYQDIVALDGNDRRTLTSRMRGEDGSWTEIMTARYRRTGS
jgi:hypothetical protein